MYQRSSSFIIDNIRHEPRTGGFTGSLHQYVNTKICSNNWLLEDIVIENKVKGYRTKIVIAVNATVNSTRIEYINHLLTFGECTH